MSLNAPYLLEVIMIILVDMDNVVADFDGHLSAPITERHPEIVQRPLGKRTTFYFEDDYPEYKDEIVSIYREQGFFLGLPVMPKAPEGMMRLIGDGHDIRICTSPLTKNDHCLHEKYHWIKQNLPADFDKRLIVTKDKTFIHGDILIDDKPTVSGTLLPIWRHVIFDAPYNRQEAGPRMNWNELDRFLEMIEGLKTAAT